MPSEQSREILLAPQTYAYMQKEGSGTLTVHVGPGAIAATQQDVPTVYDQANRRYQKRSLDQAVQECPRAAEGEYVILENPVFESDDLCFPAPNGNHNAKEGQIGRRVVIPGPWCQPLWPGQSAKTLEGHKLRTNQYLIAVVYNEQQAKENWDKTIIKAQTEALPTDEETSTDEIAKKGLPRPESFAVGTRIIIKGTDASFYIPCTGVEVVRDETTGEYVREAVTLERLEYCSLIDESGKKEYPTGPKVVFPKATQVFDTSKDRKRRKWRAIELNQINGIHLKCVADFVGPDITKPAKEDGSREDRQYREGEELFITGTELSIYYPREEFVIIEYGEGNKRHFSTAIPKGEGRYVINRETGEVKLVKGPKMLLCDPRHEIPVRRVLAQGDCALWYPNNEEAKAYNLSLEEMMRTSPSARSGLISEGDVRKSRAKAARRSGTCETTGMTPSAQYLAVSDSVDYESVIGSDEFTPEEAGQAGGGSGSVTRGTKYTEQRTLTLDTKYSGVPKIEVWPGYAVLVVGSEGARKVLLGPQVYLLEYDEKLGHMYLSTGKPKTTDRLLKTANLQVQNNQVGDVVPFDSSDHVRGTVKISLRVNFEGDSQEEMLRWFSVENYVKYLTDHVRSVVGGMAKRHTIAEIKSNYVDLIRTAVLGSKGGVPVGQEDEISTALNTSRPGMSFSDNGMRVIEVEVLDLQLQNHEIACLLEDAQHEVVRSDIQLDQARKRLRATQETEKITREEEEARHATSKLRLDLQAQTVQEELQLSLARVESELAQIAKRAEVTTANEAVTQIAFDSRLERELSEAEQNHQIAQVSQRLELEKLDASTKAAVDRFAACKDGMYETLVALQRDDLAAQLGQHCTIESWLSGDDLGSSIGNLLSIAPTLKGFYDKATEAGNNRLRAKSDPVTTS